MPAPFGWNPVDFWVPFLTLSAMALLMAVGVPIAMRRWNRSDHAERERVAAVLRSLVAELGGEFIGPRLVMGVSDDGDEYGPVPDYGTASVTASGLTVEVGVQVMGGPTGKCLRVLVPLPPGGTWTVTRLQARAFRWSRGAPSDLRTFRRCYRADGAELLSEDARTALLDLLRDATDVRLDDAGLTVWALRPRQRADPLISGVTSAAALVTYVRRTAAAAARMLHAA